MVEPASASALEPAPAAATQAPARAPAPAPALRPAPPLRRTTVDDAGVEHFRTFGVVILRDAVDATVLGPELDAALADGARASFRGDVAAVTGCYVPMMCERTPRSVELVVGLASLAAQLLGTAVLPVRAKGVCYASSAAWHRDSERRVGSVGFAAYLEPLGATTGALRVVPGSHRGPLADDVRSFLAARRPQVAAVPAWPLETRPGDVIAFDEHLFHASVHTGAGGGPARRQWRVDYVAEPPPLGDAADRARVADVQGYFADIYPPDWDGGYDVDRFPTYGPYWRARAPAWAARLRRLGAEDAALAGEAYARSRRS